MRCPVRSRSGSPFRFEPRAAPAAIAPVRRYAASAPSRPRAAPAGPQATLHVFRSRDRSLSLSFLSLQQLGAARLPASERPDRGLSFLYAVLVVMAHPRLSVRLLIGFVATLGHQVEVVVGAVQHVHATPVTVVGVEHVA